MPFLFPFNSEYQLKAGETFVTPEFIFTYSYEGTGKVSRKLHNWARKYRVKDGEGNCLTLLNNWEKLPSLTLTKRRLLI